MDKLLQQFSIVEISKKTHISPIFLEKLKLKDFSKISKIKLLGFIKILEEEYPEYDFSTLKEEIKDYFETSQEKKVYEEIKEEKETQSSNKTYLLAGVLIIGIIFLIYKMQSNKNNANHLSTKIVEKNETFEPKITKKVIKVTTEKNRTKKIKAKIDINPIIKKEENITNQNIQKNIKIDNNLTLAIIPQKKVWYKVIYLDNFKSKEYLTSKEVDLNGSRDLFIKFGHGLLKLVYNNKVIEPNTKSITRIVIKNHKLSITKKRLKEFK